MEAIWQQRQRRCVVKSYDELKAEMETIQPADVDAFPDVIRIETVGKCNFKCIHCPTGTEPNNRRVLKPEKFNEIISSFQRNQYLPRVVVLYHGGEPLLNKWLPSYIKILKDLGVSKTVITTNASLLTEKKSEDLIKAGLDELKVSFDGNSPEENNKIRVKGDFSKESQNVINFLKLKRKFKAKNPQVIISNVRFADKNNAGAVIERRAFEDYPDFILEKFVDFKDELVFRSFPAMVWPGLNQLDDYYEYEESVEHNPTYCKSLFETTTIMSDGNVVACCYDLAGESNFGSVNLETVFVIWKSNKYTKFRQDFKEKRYSKVCKKCDVVKSRLLIQKPKSDSRIECVNY